MKRKPLFILIIYFILFICSFNGIEAYSQENTIKSFKEQIEKYKEEGNNRQVANYLNKLGYSYWRQNNFEKAKEAFKESLEINERVGNLNAITTLTHNIGMIYTDKNQYTQALNYFNKSLQYKKQSGKKAQVASELINIASTLSYLGKYNESVSKLEEALSIAKEIKNNELIRSCYGDLAKYHEKLGNSQKSMEYFNLYSTFDKHIKEEEYAEKKAKDQEQINQMKSITNKALEESKEKEEQLEATSDSLKKMEQISRERQLELKNLKQKQKIDELKQKEKNARNALIRNTFIAAFVLMIVIAILLYRGIKQKQRANALLEQQNEEIMKQKEEIDEQNLHITNSINYAKRIQQSMLPKEDSLRKYIIRNSFILFKPRDVVSGDFYYFTKKTFTTLTGKSEEVIIISAIDCTGHGVPGAFMSLIGYNHINEIIGRGTYEPDEILYELHKAIRISLKQHKTDNRDGMDMALCVIKDEGRIIEFAGAKNPLVMIQGDELKTIKGNHVPIGGMQKEKTREFKKHVIQIDQPTSFYIYSDGYQDQFGGQDGDKFMGGNFKKLLKKIHEKPMKEQSAILDQNLKDWMGDKYKQVDDILVIGFKLGM